MPLADGPCASCTAFLDQLEGAAEHMSQRVNLAIVGKAPIGRIMTFAQNGVAPAPLPVLGGQHLQPRLLG